MRYVVKERLENLPLTYVLNNITEHVPYRHNRNQSPKFDIQEENKK